ncbi:amiloride-sensitive sodium channel subunit beta-like [Patella vulgata]|uniref:amiloride-sensitive sodium channel subunit beta-like n=1 Tax=Patella vulgata TaxID=6465 RepID=UPI0024A8FE13|nr:amiloride-sensitive sodium channel subunit beta-like [Patella vulgata]
MSNGKEPWTYGKIGRRFAERTSMQGIPYILHSKTRYAKVAWTFIFMIGTGAMIFHLYYLSNIYFQFPKKTSVTLGFESLSFPAVTFCNVNPMKRSQRNLASAELQQILEAVKPSNVADLYKHYLIRKRLKMGHDIEDMLVKCSFAGRTCHPENFTQITNSNYGNCYTLQTSVFKSRRSGPDQGLELMFYLENNEYIRGITNGNGAQVLIHDRDVMPHPYDQGIAVSSATETMIGLNLKSITIA